MSEPTPESPQSARQRKLQRRKEQRVERRKALDGRSRRSRLVNSLVLALIFMAIIYGVLFFVFDFNPFVLPGEQTSIPNSPPAGGIRLL